MPEFDQLQAKLKDARAAVEKAKAAEVGTSASLRASQSQLAGVNRVLVPGDAAKTRLRDQLQADITRLTRAADQARKNRLRAEALGAEGEVDAPVRALNAPGRER